MYPYLPVDPTHVPRQEEYNSNKLADLSIDGSLRSSPVQPAVGSKDTSQCADADLANDTNRLTFTIFLPLRHINISIIPF
jgi:hypothetical protein